MKTKTGKLTSYALACGYVETKTKGPLVIRLWKESQSFHVRMHSEKNGRIFWDSFQKLNEARALFNKCVN